MPILYVETNLLIAVATGRDSLANILLDQEPRQIRFVVPGICFLEALIWMEGEKKRRKDLGLRFSEQVHELGRDVSGVTRTILYHLEEAKVQNEILLDFIGARLDWAIERLSALAEILPVTAADLERSRNESLIKELTDNLILHCILNHARSSVDVDKALLTENRRDFDRSDARTAMSSANLKYFPDYKQLMAWVDSRPGAPPGWITV